MYISCEISNGLGNRFFQYAAMLGYAEKYGHTPVFVKEWIKGNESHPGPCDIMQFFPNIPILEKLDTYETIQERHENAFTYMPLPNIQKNVKLIGCFQSEQYFPTYRIESPLIQSKGIYTPTIFLHVRRGDFLIPELRHHKVDLTKYYRYALEALAEQTSNVIVCSDDIQWSKENLPKEYPFVKYWIWFEGNNLETLQAMSQCRYGGICANSTFSWWGAYWNTSPEKKIIMPNTWGYPPLPKATDVYPKQAIVFPI